MKEQNKAIDEKALTELRKLVVEREKLDGRIKELLGCRREVYRTLIIICNDIACSFIILEVLEGLATNADRFVKMEALWGIKHWYI